MSVGHGVMDGMGEPDGQCFCAWCERVHAYCECDEYAHLGTHSTHGNHREVPHPMGE